MRSQLISTLPGFWFLSILAASGLAHGGAITDFPAGGTTITFEDLAGGNCNLCGPSVTNQYPELGVIFNNPTFPGQDTVDTNLTYSIPGARRGLPRNKPGAKPIKRGSHTCPVLDLSVDISAARKAG